MLGLEYIIIAFSLVVISDIVSPSENELQNNQSNVEEMDK
jgi:hypothetical protein